MWHPPSRVVFQAIQQRADRTTVLMLQDDRRGLRRRNPAPGYDDACCRPDGSRRPPRPAAVVGRRRREAPRLVAFLQLVALHQPRRPPPGWRAVGDHAAATTSACRRVYAGTPGPFSAAIVSWGMQGGLRTTTRTDAPVGCAQTRDQPASCRCSARDGASFWGSEAGVCGCCCSTRTSKNQPGSRLSARSMAAVTTWLQRRSCRPGRCSRSALRVSAVWHPVQARRCSSVSAIFRRPDQDRRLVVRVPRPSRYTVPSGMMPCVCLVVRLAGWGSMGEHREFLLAPRQGLLVQHDPAGRRTVGSRHP
jgi:hypothetical protein